MKVKELISELQKYDENTEVMVYDYENLDHVDEIELREEVEVFMCNWAWEIIGSTVVENMEKAKEHASMNKWCNAKYRRIVTIFYD